MFEKQFDTHGDSPHSMRPFRGRGNTVRKGRRARELTAERRVRQKFYASSNVTPQHSEESRALQDSRGLGSL